MKIENAIILAAGRGSRMEELTNECPKCMQTIKGKTVIQRTIDVFKYKNIKNIVVITGYKSRILRSHLNSLFDNIIFIENKKWEITNSIQSMSRALKYLKNSVVIDSDIYINNKDVILTDVEFSGYSAVKANHPKEWQLISNADGFIEDVTTSKIKEGGLPIIDVSYWTEKDAKLISAHIKKAVQDERKLSKYWDEIPLLDFRKDFCLKRYDVEEDDLMEFDTKQELMKVRKKVCSAD